MQYRHCIVYHLTTPWGDHDIPRAEARRLLRAHRPDVHARDRGTGRTWLFRESGQAFYLDAIVHVLPSPNQVFIEAAS